mmetsp:Transcript_4753/g.12385  ORF Transcript_4753/g.12385 Transcript_4753/m.12385 type:complete len:330 (+) Transcript_4753:26-1015(+)
MLVSCLRSSPGQMSSSSAAAAAAGGLHPHHMRRVARLSKMALEHSFSLGVFIPLALEQASSTQEGAASGDVPGNINASTINLLGSFFAAATAGGGARIDAVPLLACAGWTIEEAAKLADAVCTDDADEINGIRRHLGLPEAETITLGEGTEDETKNNAYVSAHYNENVSFAHEVLAVGGTFDRLHAGHRLLLSAAAVTCTSKVLMGIATDELLANKTNGDLIARYDERVNDARSYLQSVNPKLEVVVGPLSDPKEPPAAATDASCTGLVVSAETLDGGHAVQRMRREILGDGVQPLDLIVVGLITASGEDKISSTALRREDRRRETTGA